VHILEKNMHKINWKFLSGNVSALHLLEKNQSKIDWVYLSGNSSIFELDYDALKKRCSIYKEELIQKTMHPLRIQRYLDDGYDIDEIDNLL